MHTLIERYRSCFREKGFASSLALSFLLLFVGIVVTWFAIVYATDHSSNSVTDIILSNIPVFDVDGIFVYGPVIYWVIVSFYLLSHPKKIPFSLKTIGIFLLIRSAFISMTHIGPFIPNYTTSGGILGVFTTGNDLFFSSHTGLPFLVALVLWKDKYIRYFSLAASVFFGVIVLLAHLHYTIDVFGAFFITFSIFSIAKVFFKKDFELFRGSASVEG